MLRPEGVWTLSQRLDSPGQKGLDNEPTIRPLIRKEQHTKTGTLTLQDAPLSCGKRMAYAAVGGRIGAKPVIRFSGRKGVDTKIGTLTLQGIRFSCDKRMAYTAV